MQRTIARVLAVATTLTCVALGAGGAAAGAPTAIATRFTTIPGDPLPTMRCQVVEVELGAGTIEPLGPLLESELCPVDYAARDDGRIYGVTLTGLTTQDPSPLVLVDPATGVQTVVGSTGVHVTDIGGLEFDAAETLWFAGNTQENGCDQGQPCLYRVNPDTAAATFVGQLLTPAVGFIGGLTRSCGEPLYTNLIETAPRPGAGVLSTLDTATARLAPIGDLGGTTAAGGLAFADDEVLWAVVASALAPPRTYSSASIDPATGAATPVATLPVSDDPAAFETMTGLTFGPLDCAVEPVVLEPTFTG